MTKQFQKCLFIFRRDLRLEDNTGLLFALQNAEEVIPCFIFTPEQITHNPYQNLHCLQFMLESLEDLEDALKEKGGKLYLFFDEVGAILTQCIEKLNIDAVVVNSDYTPYSLKRDKKMEVICKKNRILFHSFEDALLHSPEETIKKDGHPYKVFTPFYHNASTLNVAKPIANRYKNYFSKPIAFAERPTIYQKILPRRLLPRNGGRKAALKILKKMQDFSDYAKVRDIPSLDATTHLSPHLKFTTCSIREVYFCIAKELGVHAPLIRSLYWRDFFTSIAFHFPHVFKGAFHKKFDRLKWTGDQRLFQAWCEGRTGVPIVDAGMRQLNTTGYMHNRLRMITATFLVKDLHVNWRLGEKYFAKQLIDYDPAVNNGNWQWVASTGCDAQPYFRIFNPWAQSAKFDPEGVYIKQWIPELRSFSAKELHEWHLKAKMNNISYPPPLVDHAIEAKKTLSHYKKIAK